MVKMDLPDISVCGRCGSYEHIWHVWGKGDRRDEIVGSACTRCLWTCGEASIITAISCKITEFRINIAREREQRKRARASVRRIFRKWRR